MTDDLPTARTTLAARYVRVLVFCRSCRHQADADLQAIVESGRGDVPLVELRFRCSQCGNRSDGLRGDLARRGEAVVMAILPSSCGPHRARGQMQLRRLRDVAVLLSSTVVNRGVAIDAGSLFTLSRGGIEGCLLKPPRLMTATGSHCLPMLQRCSSSPRQMPLRSAPSSSSAANCRPRSSCAGCFPGITDNAQARECARTIAGWKPLRPVKRMPKPPRLRRVR